MENEREHCEETRKDVVLMTKSAFWLGLILGIVVTALLFLLFSS